MSFTQALKNKIKGVGEKVGSYFNNQKRLQDAAASEMDKKYPQGWSQSVTNMTEFNQIRKRIKNDEKASSTPMQ